VPLRRALRSVWRQETWPVVRTHRTDTDKDELSRYFAAHGWLLFDPDWVRQQLKLATAKGYENDVAFMVARLLAAQGRE
jgi:hypothetical protein